ncbi:MAG: c-type cytochrome [Alphaproteobacteria bacterium]
MKTASIRSLLLALPLLAPPLLAGCVPEPLPAAPANAPPPAPMSAVERGLAVAERGCALCHQVLPDRPPAQEVAAPSFIEVANLPGRNRGYLRGFATRRHVVETMGEPRPVMPTFFLSPEEREDVIAFILSYQRPDAPSYAPPEPIEPFE